MYIYFLWIILFWLPLIFPCQNHSTRLHTYVASLLMIHISALHSVDNPELLFSHLFIPWILQCISCYSQLQAWAALRSHPVHVTTVRLDRHPHCPVDTLVTHMYIIYPFFPSACSSCAAWPWIGIMNLWWVRKYLTNGTLWHLRRHESIAALLWESHFSNYI
jgi:hypothetical protein